MNRVFVSSLFLAAAGQAVSALQVAPTEQSQQSSAPLRLPYVAVHDPEFISAAAAAFMKDDDRVIGLMSGTIAKAYPAGILAQHGLVQDRSPKGPIAVTW